uniref:Uncharacterized protein n=1 Tax=Utricularia reniformis TaxID=192314 RepID=A0A1Y0AZ03_9LAMI|nr:hypothetical protein AEK19_MT1410 [Utricularia reniformis]ART30377.1 hypothetical protein AEK19_MT1410 [Utricularia reniformis]
MCFVARGDVLLQYGKDRLFVFIRADTALYLAESVPFIKEEKLVLECAGSTFTRVNQRLITINRREILLHTSRCTARFLLTQNTPTHLI